MTGTAEFEIAGIKYRAKPMDARRQFHVAMKFLAVIGNIGEMNNPMTAIASLSDEATDYVLNSCLAVVERQAAGEAAWSPIMTPDGVFMFEDLRTSLGALVQIVVPVVEANVQGFLSALPEGWFAAVAARIMSSSSASIAAKTSSGAPA